MCCVIFRDTLCPGTLCLYHWVPALCVGSLFLGCVILDACVWGARVGVL